MECRVQYPKPVALRLVSVNRRAMPSEGSPNALSLVEIIVASRTKDLELQEYQTEPGVIPIDRKLFQFGVLGDG